MGWVVRGVAYDLESVGRGPLADIFGRATPRLSEIGVRELEVEGVHVCGRAWVFAKLLGQQVVCTQIFEG